MISILIIWCTFHFLILGVGFVAARKICSKLNLDQPHWLELTAVGAGLLTLGLGLLGIGVAIIPWEWRHVFALGSLALLLVFNAYLFGSQQLYRVHFLAPLSEKILYVGFVTLTVIALLLAHLPIQLPAQLPDGAYVAKADVLAVRIQKLTGNLPADNSIPHVVAEYLLRDISFKEHRPILPGQEVSNRPILMSLVILPFRAALSMPERMVEPLPTFEYVGKMWPDFRVLIDDDRAYQISLAVGILLNALMFLGGAAYLRSATSISVPLAIICSLGVLSSPYFLFQTVFIWPKAMAGFFIALALLMVHKKSFYGLGAIFIGAAYLSHPYAMVFIAAFLMWVVYDNIFFQKRSAPLEIQHNGAMRVMRVMRVSAPNIARFLIVLVVIVAPWVVWTKLILQVPSSDLIEQNFLLPGITAVNFIWVRVVNLSTTFLPYHWFNYPFKLQQFILVGAINAVGAAGVVAYLFFMRKVANARLQNALPYLVTMVLPSFLVVTIFSYQAVPAVHGLQLPFLLITLYGYTELLKHLGDRKAILIMVVPFALNGLFLVRYLIGLC
jgi:hypothetical protein